MAIINFKQQNHLVILFAFIVMFGHVRSQLIRGFSCPAISPQITPNIPRIQGTYFEVNRYPSLFEFGLKCVIYDFSDYDNDRPPTKLTISGVKLGKSKVVTIHGSLSYPLGTPSVMSVKLPPDDKFPNQYYVYQRTPNIYNLLSCTNYGAFSLFQVHVLASNRIPNKDELNDNYEALRELGIPTRPLIRIDQTRCYNQPFTPQ